MDLVSNARTFEKYIRATHRSVVCDDQGHFHRESRLTSIIRRCVHFIFRDLFGWEARKHLGWLKGLVCVFDYVEQNPGTINKSQLRSYFKTARTVKTVLRHNKSLKVKEMLLELKLKKMALKYRLGDRYKTKYNKVDPDSKLFQKLKTQAEAWKKTQIAYKSHELTASESHQLETITCYRKWAALLKDHSDLQTKFFDWALLAKNNVDIFVQFPKITTKLTTCGLADRIGKYGGQDLQIEKIQRDGRSYKDVTLPFEGKRESILNETKEITLAYDYKLTLGEIFQIFKNRRFRVGNLEYFGGGQGITNWNPNEWGAFNPAKNDYERIDVNDPDWLRTAPFSEEITGEEAQQRFEDKHGEKLLFNSHDWVFTVLANNQFAHINLTGAHTVLCIAPPMENGKRKLYYLSKFPWDFPDFEKEKKKYVRLGFDTVKGAIQLPDENFYQIRRDQETISWRASEGDAQIVLKRIANDRKKIEKEAFHFQILIYNCTDWVFKKLRHIVTPEERDDVSAMNLRDARPEGFARKIIKMPKMAFDLSVRFIKPLGRIKKRKDGTEKVVRLTPENGPWNGERLHPAMIILRKREKKVKIFGQIKKKEAES